MNLRNITIFAYALVLAIVASGCSSIQNKLGLGSATASATEHAAANEIAAANASAGDAQKASYESGAGRQVGQAAGQEMFKKVPYLGSTVGGVVGSNVEKGVRTSGPATPTK